MAFAGFHVFMIMVHVVVVFQSANSLSCYKCTSETSWADCDSKMNKLDCPSESPNCVRGVTTCTSGDVTKTVYYKRCGAPGDKCGPKADDTPGCSSSSSMSWSFSNVNSCCSGDNCNSGSFHRINKAGLGMCMAITVLALRLILAERF